MTRRIPLLAAALTVLLGAGACQDTVRVKVKVRARDAGTVTASAARGASG